MTPSDGLDYSIQVLETAGLVRLMFTSRADGHTDAFLLEPGEAREVGERLVNAAIDVAAA